MKFIPYPNAEKPYGFTADDPAALYLYAKNGALEPPEEFRAVVLGSRIGGGAEGVSMKFAPLQFMASALFGEARESGSTGSKWSGDSYKFAIYENTERHTSLKYVILRTDGGGFYAYAVTENSAVALFESLVTLPMERLWDLCMVITRAYECGVSDGRAKVEHGFLNGSLTVKKKKLRKQNAIEFSIAHGEPRPGMEPRSPQTATITNFE